MTIHSFKCCGFVVFCLFLSTFTPAVYSSPWFIMLGNREPIFYSFIYNEKEIFISYCTIPIARKTITAVQQSKIYYFTKGAIDYIDAFPLETTDRLELLEFLKNNVPLDLSDIVFSYISDDIDTKLIKFPDNTYLFSRLTNLIKGGLNIVLEHFPELTIHTLYPGIIASYLLGMNQEQLLNPEHSISHNQFLKLLLTSDPAEQLSSFSIISMGSPALLALIPITKWFYVLIKHERIEFIIIDDLKTLIKETKKYHKWHAYNYKKSIDERYNLEFEAIVQAFRSRDVYFHKDDHIEAKQRFMTMGTRWLNRDDLTPLSRDCSYIK